MLKVMVLGGTRESSQNLQASIVLAGHEVRCSQDLTSLSVALKGWCPDVIALDLSSMTLHVTEVFAVLTEHQHKVCSIFSIGEDRRLMEAISRSAKAHGVQVLGELQQPFSAAQLQLLLSAHPQHPRTLPRCLPVKVSLSKTDLLQALQHRYFYQVYQPQVCVQTGRVIGFETLCRLKCPFLGLVSPDYFIPLCEHFELIDDLTEMIIAESVHWFSAFTRQHQDLLAEQCSLSINISAANLRTTQVFGQLRNCCQQHQLAPSRIKLELTETAEIKEQLKCLDLLTELRLEGFELSIDDFGTGFSSLQQLLNLPFSELKLDKTITQTLSYSRESQLVLESMISMAHLLGMFVVAEGIEDQNLLQILRDMQCDAAQGFYVAQPMLASELTQWLIDYTKAEQSTKSSEGRLQQATHSINVLVK